jgi:hypothetical protein
VNDVVDQTLNLRRVETRRDQERFLRLPWSLYAEDPAFCPPLLALLRDRLSPERNPYFRHAEVAYFLAERGGQAVGRISAQICQLAQKHHGHGTGHYGLFECENDPVTARALFDAAAGWLQAKGMSRMLGPFDLSINDEVGMLVAGFEYPPFVMMGHHRDYYAALLNDVGLSKAMDLFAYHLDISLPYTDRIQRIVNRSSRTNRIAIRQVARKDQDWALRQALEVFKDGWSENWGYLPPTEAEVERLIHQLRPLLGRGLVALAEVDDELAGVMVVLPNLYEWIGDLDGRLWPVGWLWLLWRLRYASFDSVRVPLMGIRKRFHDSRIGAAVALSMIDYCRAHFLPKGVTQCEMSWILESNAAMRSILNAAGCEPYKRYRVYSKFIT